MKKAMTPKEGLESYAALKKEREGIDAQLSDLKKEGGRSDLFQNIYNDLTLTLEEILTRIARPVKIPSEVYDISMYTINRKRTGRKWGTNKTKTSKPRNEKLPLVSWAVEIAEELDKNFSIEKHLRVFSRPFKDKEKLEFLEKVIQNKRSYFAVILPTVKCPSDSQAGRVILVNPTRGCATYIVPKRNWQKYAKMKIKDLKTLAKAFETNPHNPDLPWVTRYEMPKKMLLETGFRWKRDVSVLLMNKPERPKKIRKFKKDGTKKRGPRLTLHQKIELIKDYQKKRNRVVPPSKHPLYKLIQSIRRGVRNRMDDSKVNNNSDSYTIETEQLEFEKKTGIPLDPKAISKARENIRLGTYKNHLEKVIEHMENNNGNTPPESIGPVGIKLSAIRKGFHNQKMIGRNLSPKSRDMLPKEIARLYLIGDPQKAGGVWLNRDENGNKEPAHITLWKIDNYEIYR